MDGLPGPFSFLERDGSKQQGHHLAEAFAAEGSFSGVNATNVDAAVKLEVLRGVVQDLNQ